MRRDRRRSLPSARRRGVRTLHLRIRGSVVVFAITGTAVTVNPEFPASRAAGPWWASTRRFGGAGQTVPREAACLALVGVEGQLHSDEALVQLLRPAGANDRGRDAGLSQDP